MNSYKNLYETFDKDLLKIRKVKNCGYNYDQKCLYLQLLLVCLCVRACVRACVCVCVCVCARPSTLKASSVWIRWDIREQINDVMLKTLNSYADSLHRYLE